MSIMKNVLETLSRLLIYERNNSRDKTQLIANDARNCCPSDFYFGDPQSKVWYVLTRFVRCIFVITFR